MVSEKWQKVLAAKEKLGLEDRATLKQVKAAYRRLSKEFHPDLTEAESSSLDEGKMQELNAAYATLLEFFQTYSYSLVPDENQPLKGEDWWLDRFGEDPLWGRKKWLKD